MAIREFNSVDDMLALRPAWCELLQHTPQANFFQSFDWLAVYWKHYGAKQRLRVLAIEQSGATIGILPIVVRSERTKLGRIKFATYPLDFWGSFYGPIGRDPQQILCVGLNYLLSKRRDWDVLELRWIGGASEDCEQYKGTLRECGMDPVATTFDSTAIIELSGSWDDYLAGRTAKWRNNYRRWSRRLDELGEVRYERYRPEGGRDADPRWDLYEHCLQLASSSWQGSSKTGTTLTHAQIAQFLRDVHEAAARCGGLDLNLLYVNERPIAFAYNYHYRGHVFGLRVGYDPEFSSVSAGNLLYARAIEDSFRRGDWRYDMGPGALDAKRHLWTDVLPLYRLSCFRPYSLRQQLMRWKRRAEAAASI
jgi:CelD/BcsL family acetyltransferase involved in cellulose biosynthesis